MEKYEFSGYLNFDTKMMSSNCYATSYCFGNLMNLSLKNRITEKA